MNLKKRVYSLLTISTQKRPNHLHTDS